MKKKINTTYVPKYDDYELPAGFPLDRRKLKPNRFAGRVKFTHGGVRPGSGRKPAPEPLERHTITFYKSPTEYLRKVDTNLSKAIRKLIAAKAKQIKPLRKNMVVLLNVMV